MTIALFYKIMLDFYNYFYPLEKYRVKTGDMFLRSVFMCVIFFHF